MKSNNTIEINGRLYDAKTGTPIKKDEKPVLKATPEIAKVRPVKSTSRRSIDGFSAHPQSRPTPKPKTAIKVAAAAPQLHQKPAEPTKTTATVQKPSLASKKTARNTSATPIKRKPKHSTTLHRGTVKKPEFHSEASFTPQPTLEVSHVSSPALMHADPSRAHRAEAIEKSSAIARFNRTKPSAPASLKTIEQPQESENLPSAPKSTHTAVALPVSPKERLISKAMSNIAVEETTHHAKHKHHAAKRSRIHGRHITKYASTALVVLVLAGYVTYLNVPSLSMKVAAHRAGFAATLPGYKPSGYSLSGPIAYSPGEVTLNFRSTTDGRRFSLKQQPTTWDSTALLENYVTRKNQNYLTYQDRGLTIYIYDGSSASWVNAGKMYHLEGNNSQLDTDQLLKLATSV